MELPKRKTFRLKDYDYSSNGAYFVTICTQNRQCLLGSIVGEGFHALPQISLSDIGREVENSILYIHQKYECIDKYIILPNHIHMIVLFSHTDRHGNLSLQEIIARMKSFTTMKFNEINHSKISIYGSAHFMNTLSVATENIYSYGNILMQML